MRRVIQGVVASAAVVSAAVAGDAVQWRVEDGGNGHWYAIHFDSEYVCWDNARVRAESRGGHLVSLTSASENDFVVSSVIRPADPGSGEWGPYMGATAQGLPWGQWRWVTGEPWAFSGFAEGEPNSNGSEVHLHFRHWQYGLYWNDSFACGMTRSFVVEWSADCNGDGIVDYGQCRDGSLPDFNGNNVPDCCERGESCAAGSYPVQWRVEEGGSGHWYQFRRESSVICWNAARGLSEHAGGHLASVTSAGENRRLLALTVPNNPGGIEGGPYIGATSEGRAWGDWYWITGEPFQFAAWMTGAPNGSAGLTEPYVHFWRWSDLGWNDQVDCGGSMHSYLIEWSADCNSDGIVDYGQILQGQLADANANGVPDSCESPTCADADLYPNGAVNGADLGILLSEWGAVTPVTSSDFNRDGVVDGSDLGILLSFWGPCAP